MADKTLFDLPPLESPGLSGDMILYLVDADESPAGDSRKVTLAELKTFINTDPTVVPSSVPWRGARVYLTSNDTGISTGYIIPWDAEAEDTDGFWSIGAPTRLTIPAGITKVRLRWSVRFEGLGAAGSVAASLRKNGVSLAQPDHYTFNSYRQDTTGFTSNRSPGWTSTIDVAQNDYFEVAAEFSMTGQDQVLADVATFFEIEVIEASI